MLQRFRHGFCGLLAFALLPFSASAERPNIIYHSLHGVFGLRQGPWKMIPHRGSGGFSRPRELDFAKEGGPEGQLYHLDDDPSETTNLWDEESEVVERMRARLREIQGEDA